MSGPNQASGLTPPQLIPDLLLPECQPSCAWVIVDASSAHAESLDSTLSRIEKVQMTYKHAFCALVGSSDDTQQLWTSLNERCPPGRVRLLMVSTYSELLPSLQSVLNVLSQTEKLKNQREYFRSEEKRAVSSESAQSIVWEGLSRLGFTDSDAMLTMNAAPSIQKMVHLFSTHAAESLAASSTVDEGLLHAAKLFFKG